jgi:hypothetical protein
MLTEKPAPDAKVAARRSAAFCRFDKYFKFRAAKKVAGAFSNDDYAGVGARRKSGDLRSGGNREPPRHLVSIRKDLPAPVAKRLKEVRSPSTKTPKAGPFATNRQHDEVRSAPWRRRVDAKKARRTFPVPREEISALNRRVQLPIALLLHKPTRELTAENAEGKHSK